MKKLINLFSFQELKALFLTGNILILLIFMLFVQFVNTLSVGLFALFVLVNVLVFAFKQKKESIKMFAWVIWATTKVKIKNNRSLIVVGILAILMIIVNAVVFGLALTEEIIFRWIPMLITIPVATLIAKIFKKEKYTVEKYSIFFIVIVSSLLFGFVHSGFITVGIQGFNGAFMFAFYLRAFYTHSRDKKIWKWQIIPLLYSVTFHSMYNIVSYSLIQGIRAYQKTYTACILYKQFFQIKLYYHTRICINFVLNLLIIFCMPTKTTEQKSGLSTASMVLSIIGLVLSLTVIGAFLGVPLALLGLIFGIIALVQKQKKGTAVAGVVIGGLVTLITIAIAIVGTIFIKRNADVIITPIMEMSDMMENDPELAKMMDDPLVQAEFETMFKERLAEKFGEDFAENEEFENREDIKTQIPVIFDEMKKVMLELKEEHSVE